MKKFMQNFLVKLLIGGLVLSLWMPSVSADDDDAPDTEKINIFNCREELADIYDVESQAYLEFLNQTFQNKSATPSLGNLVLARYLQYKRTLEATFAKVSPNVGEQEDISSAFEAYNECAEMTEAYINLAKQKLVQRMSSSNAQKKSTIFNEKYQSINDRLRQLNLDIAYMLGYYKTFQNKLPGFLGNKCMVSIF